MRTDKWDIAQKAMDRVNKERIAKGQQPPREEVRKEDTEEVEQKIETLNTGDKVEFLPLFNPKTKKWKGLGVTRIA